jgi:AcrR family transcriptional regulator
VPRTTGDVRERILRAGLKMLADEGPRSVKSSDVASAAKTSESTIFRHYDDVADLLTSIYDDCWRQINAYLFTADSEDPVWGSPEDVILKNFGHLWRLVDDPDFEDVLFVAMTYYRRPKALGAELPSEQQRLFESRILALCRAFLNGASTGSLTPEALQDNLTNFAATGILSWLYDSSGTRRLTSDQALIGIRSLLSGFDARGPGERMTGGMLSR